ncbi:uncharacterized protein KY384_005938 [Bacidia gigantensis]|uniref:uncharacterized protein n=1 Tax=Bacidia gigantensis TaxID=2732470 RepID=UPI001D04DC65|nr:uncharacterized protein KY384_005938 [Bacidia gigantensis]KAG8529302.1 hypothetical protein KY384_005938 [Bacidia gigantensis]
MGTLLQGGKTAPRLLQDLVSYNPQFQSVGGHNDLTDKLSTPLDNQAQSKARAEKAISQNPEKFQGHAPPTPGTVLEKLAHLINRALNGQDNIPYPRDTKSWLLNFASTKNAPFTDPQRMLLDDVREELNVLMLGRPDDERRRANFNFTPNYADRTMRLFFGCDHYKEVTKSKSVDLTAAEHPSYAGLGSVADFHDNLISFAYEIQINTDPSNISYYLECLQLIAEGRASDELSTKAAIEASQGRISLRDVRGAYQHLGLDLNDQTLADDTVIGTFQARLSDALKQEVELRQDLRIIGQHRSSHKIQSVAAQTVSTYEQALNFLAAGDEMNDEFITSMFTVKLEERPSEEATARQAVALIANHRKSRALKHWLDTGNLGEVEMHIGQAYARLDITDRTMEDEMVVTVYNLHAEEQPSQAEELKRALATIAKERNSKILLERSGLDSEGSLYPLGEWPVALNNIGNTCYLNSLLQFYFSIKPFRDIVLDIDELKTLTNDSTLRSKRVGGRIVTRREVDRAQRLAEELKKLFRNLITSPTYTIRPDTEVARLTLHTPKVEIARRQSIRKSMNGGERPNFSDSLGKIDASDDAVMSDGQSDVAATAYGLPDQASNNSSDTLVDAPVSMESAVTRENITENPTSASQNDAEPSAQDSANDEPATSREYAQLFPEIDREDLKENAVNRPPNHPPPVPPRPRASTDSNEAVKEAEFAAQQQDVNEIAYNVLNQMQCAIKPLSTDESGEQLDQVKELFYGKQKTHITSRSGTMRTKEEYMSDIKVNVQGGFSDIYAALDGAFDVEDVATADGIEPKYYTISRLPPILQIHIQRSQYDPQSKKQFKSENHLDFKEVIYMDRYMDSQDKDFIRRREESWAWKRRLSALETRKAQLSAPEIEMNMPDVLDCAGAYLRQLETIDGLHSVHVPPNLFENIGKATRDADLELRELHTSIKDLKTSIMTQFDDLRRIPYRLAAVFMHRGSSNAGHYWIYIYDFQAKFWRNYNDERVTKVTDISEIFEAPTGQRPPTPYFLVYVKDQLRESLITPVLRDISEPSHEIVKDVAMDDYEPIDLDSQMEMTYTNTAAIKPTTGPTGKDQWQRKKQTKDEARVAKMAKLDPSNFKSAKDVLDEQQAAQRKRKREEEGELPGNETAGVEKSADIASDRKRTSKKQKREEKGDNTVFRNNQTPQKSPGTAKASKSEIKRKEKAEKRKHKHEMKKEKVEKRGLKKQAKEEMVKEKIRNSDTINSSELDNVPEDGVELEGLDLEREESETQHQASMTASPSPRHSPAFDVGSGSSSITSIAPSTKSPETMVRESKVEKEQKSSNALQIETRPANDSSRINSISADVANPSQEELKLRLQSRIEALRAARKADGPDGTPVRSRQELLDGRRRAEEARKAQRKELRRKAKEEEARLRAETLARGSPLLSPGSPMSPSYVPPPSNLSFGRVDFGDGLRVSADLNIITESNSRPKGPPDPATALIAAQKRQSRLAGLDSEKQADIAEKDSWLNAKKRAHGEKLRDDTNLLKKTLKRKQKQKKKSEQEWQERLEGIKKGQEMRQKKREANLAKRKDEKGGKGKKSKGSKARPGFEGSFRAKAPSGDKKRKGG